jgi:hypothetical protein
LKSAKECVTTHLPNALAPKMDNAAAGCQYSSTVVTYISEVCRKVV